MRDDVIYPKAPPREVAAEVDEPYKSDYLEAAAVLDISLKASAAISRRLLERILQEKYGIHRNSLAAEIDGFLGLPGIPSHLSEAIDAVRNVGNIAAHPIKDLRPGEVVDVERGEAEWLLEVLEALFDFTFVQPKRLQVRREQLNLKLRVLGKPEMKSER